LYLGRLCLAAEVAVGVVGEPNRRLAPASKIPRKAAQDFRAQQFSTVHLQLHLHSHIGMLQLIECQML
jgi:hypothetical protein